MIWQDDVWYDVMISFCDNMTMSWNMILYGIIFPWESFLRFILFFNYSLCVCMSGFVYVSTVPMGARWGHLIPWSWSDKLLRAIRCGCRYNTQVQEQCTLLTAEPSYPLRQTCYKLAASLLPPVTWDSFFSIAVCPDGSWSGVILSFCLRTSSAGTVGSASLDLSLYPRILWLVTNSYRLLSLHLPVVVFSEESVHLGKQCWVPLGLLL